MSFIFKILLIIWLSALPYYGTGQSKNYEAIDSLKTVLEETHEISKKINLQLLLASQYININLQQSKIYARTALSLSQKANIDENLGEIYGILGDLAVMQDSLHLATKYYMNAFNIFESKSNKRNLSGISRVLGNIAYVQSDYSQALLYYLQAIKYAEGNEAEEYLDDLYTNIGAINLDAGNIKESQKYFAIALKTAEENKDSALMALIYVNLGESFLDISDSISAKNYLNKSYDIYQKLGNRSDLIFVYNCFAELERLKKNFSAAIKYLDKGIEICLQEDLDYLGPKNILLAKSYAEMGQNYLEMKSYNEALKYFRKSIQLGFTNGDINVIANSAKGLSEVWYQEKKFDSAYIYLNIHKKYSDSLLNKENIRKLASLDANFKYEQLQSIEEQKRLEESERQKRNLLVLVFIIVGLALAIVILILFLKQGRNKIEKTELKQINLKNELEVRNKELTTHVIYQMKSNEFILSITNKLKGLLENLQPENRVIIEQIIRELSIDLGKDTWKDFEIRFQQVHIDFYKNLSKKFPDLTSNELRLAAFLKLNMNTKEISAITYQSTNSIDVGRSRLRQKLGLNKEESLSAFLSRF